MDLFNFRKEYNSNQIHDLVHSNPIDWFAQWLKEAIESKEPEPTAMVLSTVSTSNTPSSRVVLLKKYSEEGFVFFTNYSSRKGEQIEKNKAVSIVFFWPNTERQVRIEGEIAPVAKEESDSYFHSRPIESQINAIISPQSKPLESKEWLVKKHTELLHTAESTTLMRPEYWGGYCISPNRIEFWQGRPGRLHDRIEFKKSDSGWSTTRLAP